MAKKTEIVSTDKKVETEDKAVQRKTVLGRKKGLLAKEKR